MAFDAHKNFAFSTVATAPSPATSGTSLVVHAGDGTLFPAVPFNATVWPAGTQPSAASAEIVRVTNIATDTFTITRTQESTSARTIVVGDQIAATITAKTLTDAESAGGLVNTYVGYNTIGGTTDAVSAGTFKFVFKQVTTSNDGLLASIDTYLKGNNTNAQGIRPFVTDDNSGAPGKIIAMNTAPGSSYQAWLNTTPRWVAVPIGVWLPAGTYWFGVSGFSAVTFYYDGSGGDYTSATNTDSAPDFESGVGSAITPTNSSRTYSVRGALIT